MTHGHAGDNKRSGTYTSWSAMKHRTTYKNCKAYKNYGGRGITVCDRWMIFENFLLDMGERPKGMSLGRINNDLGYCAENCRWETRRQQNTNRRGNLRASLNGVSKTAIEWAEIIGITHRAMSYRIKHWPIELALTEPKYERGKYLRRDRGAN